MKVLLLVFLIFIQNTLALDCTNFTVTPIEPIGCTIIDGNLDLDLVLAHYEEDLMKFANITQIKGHLKFSYETAFGHPAYSFETYVHNPNLNSFEGFHSLRTITGYLDVIAGPVVESFYGLSSLESIGEHFKIKYNSNLRSLIGLESLKTIGGGLSIQGNANLTSLNGLDSLENIDGVLDVSGNGIDCESFCEKEIIHHWKSIAIATINAQCSSASFNCPHWEADWELAGISDCIPGSECTLCNITDCRFVTKIWTGCGNGIIDGAEYCEPEIPIPCNYGPEECRTCNSDCTTSAIPGRYCGDGIVESDEGEECDTSGIQTQCPYDQTCEVCDASTCKMANLKTSYCGDGRIDFGNEVCDGNTAITICNSDCSVATETGMNCTNLETNPIEPVGCNIISGEVNLVTDEHTQEDLMFSHILPQTHPDYSSVDPYVHNPDLNSFEGFHSLHTITGYLEIAGGPIIENLYGLYSLVNIGGYFLVKNNDNLKSLDGLDALESIGGALTVSDNPAFECENLCNRNVLFYWKSIARITSADQCVISRFTCPALDPVWVGIDDCTPGSECTLCNISNCEFSRQIWTGCGNGTIEGEEHCEPGIPIPCTYGTKECKVCDSECVLVNITGRYCGDGIVEEQEECDTGANNQTHCEYGTKDCQLCSSSCTVFPATGSYCGDGIVDTEKEVCDGNNETTVCNSDCSVVSYIPATDTPVINSTESSSENNIVALPPSSEPADSVVTPTATPTTIENTDISATAQASSGAIQGKDTSSDCEYVSCTIENKNDIKVYRIENLNMDKDVVISDDEEFVITSGNLTLNKYSLTLSSTSRIKIEGCLDASNSSLFLDLTDVSVSPKPQTFRFIEFECIVGEFGSISSNSPDGVCGSIQNVYGEDHYSAVLTTNYCVSASFRLDVYYSFYVVMFVFAMVF